MSVELRKKGFVLRVCVLRQVTAMVASALDGGSDALVIHLFEECELPAWLMGAPVHVIPAPNPNDPKCGSLAYYDPPFSLIVLMT